MHRPGIDFSRLHILVVENHALMRRLLHEMLRGFGASDICETRNVPEAINRIYSRPFDLVILDFFLGELDGADFAWEVRHDGNCINREVPILLITGMPDHYKVLKVREAGVNGMLAKPIAPKDLYQRIHSMLAYPRPFVITPEYVGPMRDRHKAAVPRRPSAASFARHRLPEVRHREPADPVLEDGILL